MFFIFLTGQNYNFDIRVGEHEELGNNGICFAHFNFRYSGAANDWISINKSSSNTLDDNLIFQEVRVFCSKYSITHTPSAPSIATCIYTLSVVANHNNLISLLHAIHERVSNIMLTRMYLCILSQENITWHSTLTKCMCTHVHLHEYINICQIMILLCYVFYAFLCGAFFDILFNLF